MTFVRLAMGIDVIAFLAVGAWYVAALMRWREALAMSGMAPEMGFREGLRRQLRDPVGTALAQPAIAVKSVILLWRRSADEDVERLRRQVVRRFLILVAITIGALALALIGWHMDQLVEVVARSSSVLNYVFVAVDLVLIAYVLVGLGYLAVRFGNGHRVRVGAVVFHIATLGSVWLVIAGQISVGLRLVE